jgi:hypothetical protein
MIDRESSERTSAMHPPYGLNGTYRGPFLRARTPNTKVPFSGGGMANGRTATLKTRSVTFALPVSPRQLRGILRSCIKDAVFNAIPWPLSIAIGAVLALMLFVIRSRRSEY